MIRQLFFRLYQKLCRPTDSILAQMIALDQSFLLLSSQSTFGSYFSSSSVAIQKSSLFSMDPCLLIMTRIILPRVSTAMDQIFTVSVDETPIHQDVYGALFFLNFRLSPLFSLRLFSHSWSFRYSQLLLRFAVGSSCLLR